jgi:hypothetical protein
VHADEHKEELQSYYKLTEEDLEEITKDWSAELLIPADPAEMSDPELIGSSEATHEEHDTPGTNRRKKTEEVQNLSSASEETASESPGRGGDDEVDKEETNGKDDQQKQGEVTPPRDPVDEADPSKKRKVSPMKPTSRKKSKATKTKLQTVLMLDDFDFIIAVVSDASQDIMQNTEAKQEAMYDRIETELRGVQQALQSSRAVSTAPPPSEEPELGDEPAQLHRIADVTEAHLRRAQEEKEQATVALKQAQEEMVEQRRVAQQEKDDLHTKLKRREHRSNKRKSSCSQNSSESKKQSAEHFAL